MLIYILSTSQGACVFHQFVSLCAPVSFVTFSLPSLQLAAKDSSWLWAAVPSIPSSAGRLQACLLPRGRPSEQGWLCRRDRFSDPEGEGCWLHRGWRTRFHSPLNSTELVPGRGGLLCGDGALYIGAGFQLCLFCRQTLKPVIDDGT